MPFSKVIMSKVGPKPNKIRVGQSWSYKGTTPGYPGYDVPLLTIKSVDDGAAALAANLPAWWNCLWSVPMRGCEDKYLLNDDHCRFVSEPKPDRVEVGQIWMVSDGQGKTWLYSVLSIRLSGCGTYNIVNMIRYDNGFTIVDDDINMLKIAVGDNLWGFYSGPASSSGEAIGLAAAKVALPAVNDHVCPGCGNARCNKSEFTCWRCGGKL